MSSIGYREIEEAKTREATLRSQLRANLKTHRQAVRELKSQLIGMKQEDRAAQYAALVADGAVESHGYAIKRSSKRFTIVPKDSSLPVTRGDARFLDAILSSLA